MKEVIECVRCGKIFKSKGGTDLCDLCRRKPKKEKRKKFNEWE